jgi:phosphorylcholine metabolism protein LicD
MDQKVRDRTSDELLVRKKEFLKICDILDESKINFFLHTGILLGAIRDNDFIKWDWDIEISVFSEEFFSKIDLVVDKLKKNDFKIKQINKKKDDSKIDFIGEYPENVTGYTIWSWYYSKIRNVYWRREFSIPAKFLNSFSKIEFLGREFNCPTNTEEYLEFAYGDWRVPLRSSDKDQYNSKKYKSKSKFIILSIKQKLLKKIYELWNSIKKYLSK